MHVCMRSRLVTPLSSIITTRPVLPTGPTPLSLCCCCCCVCLQLLAMVPQPVLAVLLLYPITKESDEANKKGGCCIAGRASHSSSNGTSGSSHCMGCML